MITNVVQRPRRTGSQMLANTASDNLRIGARGGNNTSPGDAVRFTPNPAPGHNLGTVSVTFVNNENPVKFPPQTVDLLIVGRQLRLYTIGVGDGRYNLWQTPASSPLQDNMTMLTAENNFGTTSTSTVMMPPMLAGGLQLAQNPVLPTHLPDPSTVDCLVIQGAVWSDPTSIALRDNFLNRGIPVLLCIEEWGTLRSLFSAIGSGATFAPNAFNGDGAVYQYNNITDPILSGPFKNLANLYWGVDFRSGTAMWNLSATDRIVYSNACNRSGPNTSAGAGLDNMVGATAIRHRRLPLAVVCDGGFMGNNGGYDSNQTLWPMRVDFPTKAPAEKPGFGSGGTKFSTQNSFFVANFLAWAVARMPN